MSAPREHPATGPVPGVHVDAEVVAGEVRVALAVDPARRLTAWETVSVAAALLRAATASRAPAAGGGRGVMDPAR